MIRYQLHRIRYPVFEASFAMEKDDDNNNPFRMVEEGLVTMMENGSCRRTTSKF